MALRREQKPNIFKFSILLTHSYTRIAAGVETFALAMSTKRKFDEITSDDSDEETAAEEQQEQVISHAAQRRLRKKLKTVVLNEKASTEREGTTPLVASGTKKDVNSNVYSIWVGNLSFKTTPDALRQFLGDMGDIKRIHMPTKALHGHLSNSKGARGDNRGYV